MKTSFCVDNDAAQTFNELVRQALICEFAEIGIKEHENLSVPTCSLDEALFNSRFQRTIARPQNFKFFSLLNVIGGSFIVCNKKLPL